MFNAVLEDTKRHTDTFPFLQGLAGTECSKVAVVVLQLVFKDFAVCCQRLSHLGIDKIEDGLDAVM